MIGKIIEINTEFTTVSLINSDLRIQIGNWVEFSSHSVVGKVIVIERESIQLKIIGEISRIKSNDEVKFYTGINEVGIELFGNVWGEFDANLNLLDRDFNTKNLELTGNYKYDFIPVVRAGETVYAKQKLGYIELQKKLKYWILTPDNFDTFQVKKINSGTFGTDEKVVTLENNEKNYEVKVTQQFKFEDELIEAKEVSDLTGFQSNKKNSEYTVGKVLVDDEVKTAKKLQKTELIVILNSFQDPLNSGNIIPSNQNQSDYDFTIHVSQYLNHESESKELNYITFLTSQNDNYELVLQKSYNVALFLTYCGHKVLYKVDLDFETRTFESGKVVNYEGEEGFLKVEVL